MVGFDKGMESEKWLDGQKVQNINPNLTTGTDVTVARPLADNLRIAFQGPVKVGKFDIPHTLAVQFLAASNPHGRPNSDFLYLLVNGKDITGRPKHTWIINFGDTSHQDASLFEELFAYIEKNI